jgi:hypothetical protein
MSHEYDRTTARAARLDRHSVTGAAPLLTTRSARRRPQPRASRRSSACTSSRAAPTRCER